jgi:hypothetical protein
MLLKLANWTGLVGRIASAVRRDLREDLQPLRTEMEAMRKQLKTLQKQIDAGQERVESLRGEMQAAAARLQALSDESAGHARADRQARAILRLNQAQQELIGQLDALLDEPLVVAHVQAAIARTPLESDPFPHIVVEQLLPPDFYKLLRKAIPPPVFFGDQDPIKQNLRTPIDYGPAVSVRVLNFLEEVIARRAIHPAVIEKFAEPLKRHYDALFGSGFGERGLRTPLSVTGGRVMLRRPGYHLAPHRDPKRTMLTCLLYFAGAKDGEEYGTDIYRVVDDREASYSQTYYPEQSGSRCELVKRVPFRPNSMLVFLNSSGAHGAHIPADAPPALERFSYQFYIGLTDEVLGSLIKELPPERQALWRSKNEVETEYA